MDQPSQIGGGVALPTFRALFVHAWELYKKAWVSFLAFMGLYLLVLVVFGVVFVFLGAQRESIIGMLVGFLLLLLGLFWLSTSIYAFIVKLANGAEARVASALQEGWKKFLGFFWVGILVQLVMVGGLLLFFVPGVIWFVWFGFSVYVYLNEGVRGVAALKRSKALVSGFSWTVLFRYVIGGLVFSLLGFIAIIPILGWVAYFVILLPLNFLYPYLLYRSVLDIKTASPTAKEQVPVWKKIGMIVLILVLGVLYIGIQLLSALPMNYAKPSGVGDIQTLYDTSGDVQ